MHTGLCNLGQSIQNVRKGSLANRIRCDFGGTQCRSIMKEKMDIIKSKNKNSINTATRH